MKNILSRTVVIQIFITVIVLLTNQTIALAQTPTATSTPTPKITSEEREIDTIEKIKDLVASKVAELKLVDKRGILGTVKRTSNTQVTISDHKQNLRLVDIDELTKFVSEKSSFGISDIKEGNTLSVIGLYNKDTKRLLARFISLAGNIPENFEGFMVERNGREFTLQVERLDGRALTIDVASSTKTFVYEEDTLSKSGFSKILAGERILIVGFPDSKQQDTINASRIIRFPELPASGKEILTPTVKPTTR